MINFLYFRKAVHDCFTLNDEHATLNGPYSLTETNYFYIRYALPFDSRHHIPSWKNPTLHFLAVRTNQAIGSGLPAESGQLRPLGIVDHPAPEGPFFDFQVFGLFQDMAP